MTENESSRRPDSRQLVRQWTLLRLLADSGRTFSAKELADQLDTSKSTIQRDLATLERDFALVEELEGKQKRVYRINQDIAALGSITFGVTELLALHAAQRSLDSLSGTPIHGDLRSVVEKIRGFLAPRHNGGLDAMARVFQGHSRGFIDYAEHGEVIDDLVDAIAQCRECDIRYHAPWKGTTKEHRVQPHKLLWHKNALYLFASVEAHKDITTFAVHRIESLEKTTAVFKANRADLAEYARTAFGIFVSDGLEDVEVMFDADIAWRIEERVFHPDEEKERLEDGRLRYKVKTSAQWEIIPWVLSYGGMAELVSPAAWRTELATSLRAAEKRYAE